jgi:tRNA pseudouridine55 synthase
MHGILLVNKPSNITSFAVIDKIKKKFKLKKIGHSGTLDSFATGLLLIGINEATKILQYYMELEKEYEASFHLGITTDTCDITGIKTSEYSGVLPELVDIENALKDFIGNIVQIPPHYSAIKVNGKRASDWIREGINVDLKPRQVTIKNIEILSYNKPILTLRILCSKGTYIRALARDLGEKLGCGAYVSFLKRTKLGKFTVEQALEFDELLSKKSLNDNIIPLCDALPFFQKVILTPEEVQDIYHGRSIQKEISAYGLNYLGVYKNKAIAILKLENFKGRVCLKPERVFFDL